MKKDWQIKFAIGWLPDWFKLVEYIIFSIPQELPQGLLPSGQLPLSHSVVLKGLLLEIPERIGLPGCSITFTDVPLGPGKLTRICLISFVSFSYIFCCYAPTKSLSQYLYARKNIRIMALLIEVDW